MTGPTRDTGDAADAAAAAGTAGETARDGATSLTALAVQVLTTADPREKTRLTRELAATWRASRESETPLPIGEVTPPDWPARPERPELLAPRDVPRRRPGTLHGRIALMHAIAHIELNAVDLHLDVIARFADAGMPMGFYDDWVSAADDEARHFRLIDNWLRANGSHYGALPAHAGMWRGARDTADDLAARLAVVPMVLEARGLDVTPAMIDIFEKAGDAQGVSALRTIHDEEVAHVAYGSKWFNFLCGRDDTDPKPRFHALVRARFHGALKPPFNEQKRADAGLPPDFYWPLADKIPAGKPLK